MNKEPAGTRLLLTFRIDTEQRQRLKTRLAADGKTMSEIITNGLHLYVKAEPSESESAEAGPGVARMAATYTGPAVAEAGPLATKAEPTATEAGSALAEAAKADARPIAAEVETALGAAVAHAGPMADAGKPVLPAGTAARLRELRASGRSGVLSATLGALHEAGWPLPALADALGVSRQAIQVRVRQRVPAELRDRTVDCSPPPPFPRRRKASAGRLRPHLTIKIDHALRAAAHRAAAREGSSLSQVVETILDRYLHSPPRNP